MSAGGGSSGGGGGGSRRFRSGLLARVEEGSVAQYHAFLRAHELHLYVGPAAEGEVAAYVLDLENAVVSIPEAGAGAGAGAGAAGRGSAAPSAAALAAAAAAGGGASARRFGVDLALRSGALERLGLESKEEHESWLGALAAAAVPEAWPGGRGLNRKPQPLLYSMWALQHAGNAAVVMSAAAAAGGSGRNGSSGAVGSAAGAGVAAAAAGAAHPPPQDQGALEARVPSPFQRLPALKSVPAWQRKGLLLQKLRQCSIVFDGVDADRFLGDREAKRNMLLEVLDHVDANLAQLGDARVLEDVFTLVRLNIFRPLPTAPQPSGDPEEEEEAFKDAQWPHLNIVYELLLRLVSSDALDLAVKKRVLDPLFVRALLQLFDSEDARERDFLKTITHRIYSKLTQRRALIRRVICNVFYEFVLETGQHNGVGAMLEILASVINGFAVPIKEEHKATLVRALIPLHKAPGIGQYHPQLTYCMALYASKDHLLTRAIVPGLLRYWPLGAAQKQMMFLNELEDIFEYVQEDDMEVLVGPLSQRLAKCIRGAHFQVAERTLALWGTDRFKRLMVDAAGSRAAAARHLLPALLASATAHWHENIRRCSQVVLEQYEELEPAAVQALREEAEGLAVAAAAAGAGGGEGGGGSGGAAEAGAGAGGVGSPAGPAAAATPHAPPQQQQARGSRGASPAGAPAGQGGSGALPVSDLIGGATPKRQGAQAKAARFVPSLGGAGGGEE